MIPLKLNWYRASALALALSLLAGCNTASPTTALRIGMSRDEAVAVMGPPKSVAAQGQTEILNYTLTEALPNGGTLVRPYYVRVESGKVEAFGDGNQVGTGRMPLKQADASNRSANLRLGMTHDEVIAVMGPPASVSAQGGNEYLNYTLIQANSTRVAGIVRPYYVRLVDGKVEAFGFLEQIGHGPAAHAGASALVPADSMQVTNLQPAHLVPGRMEEVTATIHYSLQTRPKAVIVLLFNSTDPVRFHSVSGAEATVDKGEGDIVMHGKVKAVDWGNQGEFQVELHLLDYPYVQGVFSKPVLSWKWPVPLDKSQPSEGAGAN